MRSGIAALAIAAGVALAIAGPVAAWSSIAVGITSASSGQTLAVTGDVMAPTLLVSPALEARPSGDLGARFTATYTMRADGVVVAIQDFYPYAPGGPVSYTPTAGAIGSHGYEAGWRQARVSVLRVLVALGLPPTSDAGAASNGAEAAPARGAGSQDPRSEPLLVLAIGSLALVALALILLGLRRRATEGRTA